MKTTTFFSVVFLFLSMVLTSLAQAPDRETLLKYVSNGNAGTEFWVSFPPSYEEVAGAENTTRLFVASPVRQPVTVEVPGKGFSMTKMAVANDVVEFKLPTAIGQAYSKPTQGKAPPEKVYGKCGVHITALSPIVVYGMTRFQYTSDGFLAIPISKLGTEYIIAAYPQYTATGTSIKLPSLSNIVAAYDNTKVTFTMGGIGGAKTTGGLTAGQTSTWNLNAGDVVCFANDDDNQDISGSHVLADKPIGIVSGNQCANIPNRVTACDFIDEMELPITAWGKEYHITPIAERLYNPIIRIFAHPAYKDVKVYRDGKEWLTLQNNARTENQSFVERRVFDGPPRATVVTASAPIYIMLYNPGENDDNVSSAPFQMVITPYEQYQTEITFSPPNIKGGTLPFTRNFVDLIYCLDGKNKIPDDLEIAELQNGLYQWKKLSVRFGEDIGKKFSVKTSSGEQYATKGLSLPENGIFKIRAKKAFAAYLNGASPNDSYGFPASANVNDLTIIDTIPPRITVTDSTPLQWKGEMEDYIVKRIQKVPGKDSNDLRGYITSACLVEDYSYNIEFSYVDKIPNLSTKAIEWKCIVQDYTKDARAVFVVTDKHGNISYKDFSYKSPDTNFLVLSPVGKMVMNITKDSIIKTELILKNMNKKMSIYASDCDLRDGEFQVENDTILNRKIKPGEVVKIPVVYKPYREGEYNHDIYICTDSHRGASVKVHTTVLKSGIYTWTTTEFDSTFIGDINAHQYDLIVKAQTGKFADTAYVTNIVSEPENGISFNTNEFGEEGFQIDTSLFMNKKMIPNENEIQVPVKFKPKRSGLHSARLKTYMLRNKEYGLYDLVGYGRVATSAEEAKEQKCSIFINLTQKELIVQNEIMNKESNFLIYNQLGEHVLSGTIPEGRENCTISVQNLPVGLYIFTTEINGKKVQEKFVVMR